MKNSEWVFVKMTKSVVANLETDGIKYMDTRLQPFITWLQFMNFVTIAMISLVFLKIYNGILLLCEWIFPFKHNKLRYPLILVIGSKNELNQKIVFQLSKLFQAKIVNLQDINDNAVATVPAEQAEKQSQILFSQVPFKSQEEILKMSRFVQDNFGEVDVLLVSQNEEPAVSGGTPHVFLNNLNTQLLIQFWTVMAFLPKMLQRNHGHIVSVALSRTSNLTNTGIMRSVYEELLQTETNVKLTLIERNSLLENYLPALPTDLLAKLIIRSTWSSNSMITVPSLLCYILMIPLLVSQLVFRPVMKFVDIAYTRHHQQSVF